MRNAKAIVLVVEDDVLMRFAAFDLVESAGYQALEAGSADEAIRILESRVDIDLVLTDVEMPGSMDGIKLCHYIRERWPPVRLIVVSGRQMVDEGSLPQGARFISKPYVDQAITDAIGGLLSSSTGPL